MQAVKQFWNYLNPIEHLGDRSYSSVFPILITLLITVLLEFYVNYILKNPAAVGSFAIIIYIALILFFAFRFGIKGGLTTVVMTLFYYLYIIYSQNYSGEQFRNSIFTTAILIFLYAAMAILIGWLKEKIDILVEYEVNGRQRLMTIIRELPVGVIISDANGIVQEANKQLNSILGLKLRQGSRISDYMSFVKDTSYEHKAEVASPILKAVENRKVVKNQEYLLKKPNGGLSNVLVSSAPILDRKGMSVGGISIIQDISSMKEIEKRKDDFVNIASHELKTPITSLILYLEILKKQARKHETQALIQTIGRIEDQITNLKELIKNLLEVSRYQTGKIIFKKQRIRLDILIEEVINSLQDGTEKQKIIFSRRQQLWVNVDKYRLGQVVANLITNAKKYSSGRGDITIELAKTKDGKAKVSIQDQGIGINPSQQKRIFEKLYQVKEEKAATFPGFGMGLYISKKIVVRHKGRIWVESQIGKGSKFYFTIPLA